MRTTHRIELALLALLIGCESPAPVPWSKGLDASANLFMAQRGLSVVRGIIHLHSVYSHDACDNMPQTGGQPNATCNQHLRDALCRTHQDFAMLTDHATLMTDTDWDALFLPEPGDEAVVARGRHVASRLACPDGTSTLVMIGGENDLMPVGLEEHVAQAAADRRTVMNGADAAAAAQLRAHGALVLVAHGESHSLDQLRDVAPEAMEIYNLHANLDPKIRTAMGLEPAGPILSIAPFLGDRYPGLEPDLAFLAFWEENPAELAKFTTLLGEGRHLSGTLGTDAHENTVPLQMQDGERGDSYRRLLRWFSNHLLVSDLSAAGFKEALAQGRSYGAFEIFGAPVGFDYHAESAGEIAEMGETVALADAPSLVIVPPHVPPIAGGRAPLVRTRILRIDAAGEIEVASQEGPATLTFFVAEPGAYRVEVRTTPHHLRGYMSTLEKTLLREYVWLYANPIYVK